MWGYGGIEMEGIDFIDIEASGGGGEGVSVLAVAAGNGFEANSVFPLGAEGLDDEFGDVGLADLGISSCDKEIHCRAGSLQWACGSSVEGVGVAFSLRRWAGDLCSLRQ